MNNLIYFTVFSFLLTTYLKNQQFVYMKAKKLFDDELDANKFFLSNLKKIWLLDLKLEEIATIWHRIIYHVEKNSKIHIRSKDFAIIKTDKNTQVIVNIDVGNKNYGLIPNIIVSNFPENTTKLEICFYGSKHVLKLNKTTFNNFNLPSTIKKIKITRKNDKEHYIDTNDIILPKNIKIPFGCRFQFNNNPNKVIKY